MEEIEDIIIRNFRESIHHKEVFVNENLSRMVKVINVITDALKQGSKIVLFGNGGSAADAQHIAAELSGRFYYDREPLDAEALHVNTSYLTAVANDYSYNEIYARLIRAKGKRGDVLIGISTSGNSENIVKALETARSIGMITIGLTGDSGGQMKNLTDILINIPSKNTARIQEAHILVGHILCELIEAEMFPG